MLKIRILAIGEDKNRWVTEGIAHFTKLLSKYASIEFVSLPSPKSSASISPDEIKKQEAALFRERLAKGMTIALTDSGKSLDSIAFAKQLERWQVSSGGTVTFLIGGPFGLDAHLVESCDLALSLSLLTFSHQLVRLVLLEQLYRGYTILHNTSYHK
jgi:23S rRNA (pseudouridine1915-N3)-methyltransferase